MPDATLKDYRGDVRIKRGSVDLPFMMLTLLLLTVGVVVLLSASYASAYYDLNNETGGNATYYFTRQLIFAALGVLGMWLASRVPMTTYRKFSFWVLALAIVLLVAVLLIGTRVNGAKRWINLGFTTIQPSEVAKIGVILYFSTMICKYRNLMGTFRYGVLPFLIVLAVIVGLLVAEPHYSAAIIIILIGIVMMYSGGTRALWFIGGIIGVALLLFVASQVSDYVAARIQAWRDPFSDNTGDGYQIVQSLYAIGSGGAFGLGLGQSRQKFLYLPEEHNDFIFSIVCEELGYVGAAIILLLFALLIIRGYWLALHCRDKYSFLVCTGITSLMALQVFLNVAVCTNLIPCTGISLPFFSYGGTALVIQMIEMGIILSISRDIPVQKSVRKRREQAPAVRTIPRGES